MHVLRSCVLIAMTLMLVSCAGMQSQRTAELMSRPTKSLSNAALLGTYYEVRQAAVDMHIDERELQRASSTYANRADVYSSFGMRRSASNDAGASIVMAVFAGIAADQKRSVVAKLTEVRVELEMRGWSEALGFRGIPDENRTAYVETPAATAPPVVAAPEIAVPAIVSPNAPAPLARSDPPQFPQSSPVIANTRKLLVNGRMQERGSSEASGSIISIRRPQ